MPDFLVSAATGALSPVLNKLAALLSDEYKRFKGVRGEVKFLIRELEAMHAFLLKKSEEENPDVQDKMWMKEVRELSYDIEDSLDDFRVRVDEESTKPDGFMDKCKNLLEKTKARRRIAKEIEKLKDQVMEVSERNARYKQIGETVMNTSNETVDPRALAIFEDASRLVGIDQPKQEVISFLMKEDGGISAQLPKIVSIVGIGGIGKTTLANRVYQELKDQFQCRAFLSVSRNPDMTKILRTILSQVKDKHYSETEAGSIQQLIMEIREFLESNRYLIVVDDVWDVKTWDAIKNALPNNSCGSVIITTTRIHDVAEVCCLLYPDGWVYQPKPLEERESKRLFQNRIFGPGNECPEYLEEVSDKILKKCGGLPLAIIAISGLLANKARNGIHSVIVWDQVQTDIGRGLERDLTVEGMMGILSLSYSDLPNHLKACLLYLSIFPEDYAIDKKHLVRLWVAEGFVPPDSTRTLYESGEKSFTELINRNLILPKKIQIDSGIEGDVCGCFLHDTILDFIVRKSAEDNFVTVQYGIPKRTPPSGNKVRRLSLQGKAEGDVTLHSNKNYGNVRSIISFGLPCSLLGFKFLRVLDFTGRLLENRHLSNIGELLQLRYLRLRETRVTELPEQIGELQYLETLDIRGCNITQLPTSIVRLKRLVSLLIGGDIHYFPSGIKNMQALEELKSSVVMDIKAASICVGEIGNLTKMRHLEITLNFRYGSFDEESYVDFIKRMVYSFQQLNNLQSLSLVVRTYRGRGHTPIIFDGDDIILEVPWCSGSLRKLAFLMNPISTVPSWMKSLVNMEYLVLKIKKLDQESLCILGDLPVLVYLELYVENNGEDIPSIDEQRLMISNRYGYRSLRHFAVNTTFDYICDDDIKRRERRTSFPMLTFEAGSMPKLEYLGMDFHADITISVSNGRLDFGLKHLSHLTHFGCDMFGTELSIFLVEDAIQKELDNHPKLPYFEKFRFPSTSALALPTDLSFTIHHHSASPDLGRQQGQRRRRPRARQGTIFPKKSSQQGATIRGRELVQGALHTPDRVKGTSGAAPSSSDVLGPQLTSSPQQPLCFTFGSRSPPNDEAEQQAMDCFRPSQRDDLANAFSSALNSLSLHIDHPGSGSSATSVKAAFSDTDSPPGLQIDLNKPLPVLGIDLNDPVVEEDDEEQVYLTNPNDWKDVSDLNPLFLEPNAEGGERHEADQPELPDLNLTISGGDEAEDLPDFYVSGASPTPSDVLGSRLIAAAAQQQETLVPPCFTFSSRSPPNSESEQQAMDYCNQPSQHDDLAANAFTSAFNGLSLSDDHPGSSLLGHCNSNKRAQRT